MGTLYQLSQEYQGLRNALFASVDEETGEVDINIAEELDKVKGKFEDKALAVATVYRELGTYGENIDAEIKRLTALKNRAKREQDHIKDYLSVELGAANIKNIRGIGANISFRSSEQTVIDNVNDLPDEFIRIKTTYEPDKTKIKEALKCGVIVNGAHLETKQNIQIK